MFQIVYFFQKNMKIKYSLLYLVLLGACSNPKTSDNLENKALKPVEELVIPQQVNKVFNKILGNQERTFRGYDFGDDLRRIQESEVLEQFEDVKTHIGYSFDSPTMETVDILYFRDKDDRLQLINIDIYMNTEEASKQMLQAFTTYFNTKYGEPTIHIGTPTWETDDVTVKIKMVRTKLDTGLQIILEP